MSPITDTEWLRLTRYFTDADALDERLETERWIAETPERAAVVVELRRRWEGVRPARFVGDSEALWGRLREAIGDSRGREARARRGVVALGKHSLRKGINASYLFFGLLVIVGIAFPIWHPVATPRQRTYTTGVGEQTNLTFSDGTRVRLAPLSRLTVATGFGRTDRIVTLTGEAYFDVMRASGMPFVVRTGTVTTRVLGTTFSVQQYDPSEPVRVVVLSGKVTAGGRGTPITLTPGTIGRVTDSTATIARINDVTAYAAWTQGRLVFDDAPVPVVLSTLGRWYGYTFRLTDSSTATQHVSATFKASAPAAALEDLKQMLDVSLTFDGQTITLVPRLIPRPRTIDRRQTRETYFTPTEEGR